MTIPESPDTKRKPFSLSTSMIGLKIPFSSAATGPIQLRQRSAVTMTSLHRIHGVDSLTGILLSPPRQPGEVLWHCLAERSRGFLAERAQRMWSTRKSDRMEFCRDNLAVSDPIGSDIRLGLLFEGDNHVCRCRISLNAASISLGSMK